MTSGALYRKRYSGAGETRSMNERLDEAVLNDFRKNQNEDVRSLHFSYSVSSESRAASRNSSFRSRRSVSNKDEPDRRSVISDGVYIFFCLRLRYGLNFSIITIDLKIEYSYCNLSSI